MIKCQACGRQNLDSSQYCDECGDALKKYRAPETSSEFASDSINPNSGSQEIPVYQSANVTSVGIPSAVEKKDLDEPGKGESDENARDSSEDVGKDSDKRNVHANLIIERGPAIGTEFQLASDESNIGRWDADNGIFPDIDLDTHDPEAKVSRKHARIIFRNSEYLLEDLGSTNGTFINRGRRLIPGNPHKIKEGDEIIVGKTFLRFHIK